ncbi:hypothetical protein [Dichotomicrobium thermohalophilum]|uniref:Uncharacterized protein n=1 Tax=Dichotomicrobium thermohalophilum TaxID=933063 RepID=A0A397Q6I5_9HYPH|nr:hypothetical protein [Dichotomicrobium thermohalophilum]RIA55415.1 hypothetical protein BXY53_0480 [Dichotomicrobium thermohalophilum]
MTYHVQQSQSDKRRRPRIQSWHAPEHRDRAPALFAADARTRRLARLVPLWPSEIESTDPADAERVVAALERALRGERKRGRAGHWSYDVNRHMALTRALQDERARLAALRRQGTKSERTGTRPAARHIETKALSSSGS